MSSFTMTRFRSRSAPDPRERYEISVYLSRRRTRAPILLNPESRSSKCHDQPRLSMSNYLQTIRRFGLIFRTEVLASRSCRLARLDILTHLNMHSPVSRMNYANSQGLGLHSVFMHRFPFLLLPYFRLLISTSQPVDLEPTNV